MARTLINGADGILGSSISRSLLNTQTTGLAVITKLVPGSNLTISQTGIDAGTGDVTVNVTSSPSFSGSLSVGTTLSVTGATTLSSTLGVTGNTSLTTLGTSGLATLASASVTGALSVTGSTGLGVANIGGTLSVAGSSALIGGAYGGGSGSYFAFNAYYSGGWKYYATDYAYFIRHDGADLSVNAAPSGSAGATATPASLMVMNQSGLISVPGSFAVTGAATFGSTLNVTGIITGNGSGLTSLAAANLTGTSLPSSIVGSSLTSVGTLGSLAVSGAATVGTTLGVTGLSTLASLSVTGTSSHTGASTFGSTLGVTGAATFGSTLSVTGVITGNGSGLTSLTAANLTGTALPSSIVGSSLTSVGTLTSLAVSGAATIGTTLGVTGASSLSTLGTSGLATLASLSVTGTSLHTGAATFGSTLGVAGAATLSSSAGGAQLTVGASTATSTTPTQIAMDTSVSSVAGANLKLNLYSGQYGLGVSSGQLDVVSNGNIAFWSTSATKVGSFSSTGFSVAGTLSVTGAATVGTTLGVTGATSLSTLGTSGLATLASLSVTGASSYTGAATFGSTLGVTGAATLSSTLSVAGAASITNATASTTSTTGALVVTGGAGVGGALNVGSTLAVTGAATAASYTSTSTGNIALQVGSNSAIRDATNGASTMYFDVSAGGATSGTFTWRGTSSYSTMMSLSSTGLSLAGQLNAGSTLLGSMGEDSNLSYGVSFSGWNATRATSGSTNNWTFYSDGTNNAGTVAVQSIYGGLTFYVVPPASGTAAQTLTSAQLFTNASISLTASQVFIWSTAPSTSYYSGALRVGGGVGIAGSMNVGSASGSSTTPTQIIMDASYSSVAGANPKLNLYGNQYGLGVSTAQLDVVSGSNIAFWSGSTSLGSINSAGLATFPSLSTTANASIGGNLYVTGTTALGYLSVGANLAVAGQMTTGSLVLPSTSGQYIGFNISYTTNWTYSTTGYGYVIRHDGADLSIQGAASGTGGTTTAMSQLAVFNQSGLVTIPGTFGVSGASSYTGAATFGSTLSAAGVVTLSNSTASTSSTTGALVVTGGAGVGGNITMGGGTLTMSSTGVQTFNLIQTTGGGQLSIATSGGSGYISNYGSGNIAYGTLAGYCHAFYINGVDVFTVTSAGAVVNGSVYVNGSAGGQGSVVVNPGLTGGSSANPGYVGFFDGAGTRRGYVGWQGTVGYLELETENGYLGWEVTGNLRVDNGVNVTSGGITVAGGSTVSGGESLLGTDAGGFNQRYTSSDSVGWRYDGSTLYLLHSSTATGGYDSGRPFYWNPVAATVELCGAGETLSISGSTYIGSGQLRLGGVGCTPQMAAVSVTAVNTLAALSSTCSGICILLVNGQALASSAAAPAFTVSGTTLTWNATNAGFSLATTDSVVAFWMH